MITISLIPPKQLNFYHFICMISDIDNTALIVVDLLANY